MRSFQRQGSAKAGFWAPSTIGPFSSTHFHVPLGYRATTGDVLYGDKDMNSVLDEQSVFSLSAAIFLTICAYSSDSVIERARYVYSALCEFTPYLRTYIPRFKTHPDVLLALAS